MKMTLQSVVVATARDDESRWMHRDVSRIVSPLPATISGVPDW
jgi:hypothetical protein